MSASRTQPWGTAAPHHWHPERCQESARPAPCQQRPPKPPSTLTPSSLHAALEQSWPLSVGRHPCRGKTFCPQGQEEPEPCTRQKEVTQPGVQHAVQCSSSVQRSSNVQCPSGNGKSHAGLAQSPPATAPRAAATRECHFTGPESQLSLTAGHALNPLHCKNNLNTTK